MEPSISNDLNSMIVGELEEHRKLATMLVSECGHDVLAASRLVERTVRHRGTIIVAGNGGSSSQSDHIAGEFVGRFRRNRSPYPAISLATSSASMTAIGNDYGYEFVFERQLAAYARSGDLVIALTTSGKSSNVVRLLKASLRMKIPSITLTGNSPEEVCDISTVTVSVPSSDTARVQEVHLLIGHVLALVGERVILETD